MVTISVDQDGYVIVLLGTGGGIALTGAEAEAVRDGLNDILERDDKEHILV